MSDQPTLDTITPAEFTSLQLRAMRMEHAVAEYAKLRVQLEDTERERDEHKQSYLKACTTIAAMHAAAVGRSDLGPVRGVVEDVEDVRLRAEQAEAERDGAYRERAHLLAWLAALHQGNAVLAPSLDIDDEDGWHLLFLTVAGRQMSWHIAPRDVELFNHVERVDFADPRAAWDGHTTAEKYERIRTLPFGEMRDAVHLEITVRPDPTHVAEAIRDIRRHGG